jgi:hypothetical protein
MVEVEVLTTRGDAGVWAAAADEGGQAAERREEPVPALLEPHRQLRRLGRRDRVLGSERHVQNRARRFRATT